MHNGGPLGAGKHAVVRRYEYYNTSVYDPLTHEALCADTICAARGVGELGDMIGAQMAAADLEIPSITGTRVGAGTVLGVNGKINCGGSCTAQVAAGTVTSLTASVPGSAVFGGWTGACSGTVPTCTVTITKDTQVQANFK